MKSPVVYGITDDLRRRILDRCLVAGDLLPTEEQLCERYKVSGMTVRQAIAVLRAEGMVAAVTSRVWCVIEATPVACLHRVHDACDIGEQPELGDVRTLVSMVRALGSDRRSAFVPESTEPMRPAPAG